MRIRSVTAHAFGPLVDQTLPFADGMTVIIGDNESGKSSWHAAIFAALCGRRRGAGRPREDEHRFIDAHKPRDDDRWLVSAEILLDDGRRIEMRQDLAGKVDCHAKDLDIGIDVSAEVMNEGTPDAARWLGLDRSSFVNTACVEQALEASQQAEQRVEQDLEKRADATHLVTEALAACGLTAPTPEAAVAALEQWLTGHQGHLGQLASAQRQWAELQALLNGRTLGQLREDADSAARRAREIEMMADPALLAAINPTTAAGTLDDFRQTERQAGTAAASASGDLQRYAKSITSVAEAEEALQDAENELARVRELEETLTLTSQFLQRAQDRVHRDIAPALAATIRQWLSAVTVGRYTDVTVNPTTLQVDVVCGPTRRWRMLGCHGELGRIGKVAAISGHGHGDVAADGRLVHICHRKVRYPTFWPEGWLRRCSDPGVPSGRS